MYSEVSCPGGQARGSLYGEVQCNMANGHIGTPCEETDTTENITFPQLRRRAVITFYQFVLKERPLA